MCVSPGGQRSHVRESEHRRRPPCTGRYQGGPRVLPRPALRDAHGRVFSYIYCLRRFIDVPPA